MAKYIEIIDGFEEYPALSTTGYGVYATWTPSGAGNDSNLVAGRVGGQALQIGYNHSLYRVVEPTEEFSCFFAWRHASPGWSNLNTYLEIARFCNQTTNMVRICTNESRDIVIFTGGTSGSAGTIELARVHEAFQRTVYYSFSVVCKIHDTLGVFKLWLNGELIIDLSNVDTRNGAPANVDRFYIGPNTNGGSSSTVTQYDDFRWDHDSQDQIKEGRGVQLFPTSDDSVQFTPSTGAVNYAMVDEATGNGDTDYNTANTVGFEDKFNFGDLPFNPDEIFAVMVSVCARKDDVATRRLQSFLESNGNRVDYPDLYLSTDYVWRRYIQELNPDGDVPWDKAAVDALKGGYTILE